MQGAPQLTRTAQGDRPDVYLRRSNIPIET